MIHIEMLVESLHSGVIIPADHPLDGMPDHVNVDRSGEIEEGEVSVDDVLGIDPWHGQVRDHLSQSPLSCFVHQDIFGRPVHVIHVEVEFVAAGEFFHQGHHHAAAYFGYPVEEEKILAKFPCDVEDSWRLEECDK